MVRSLSVVGTLAVSTVLSLASVAVAERPLVLLTHELDEPAPVLAPGALAGSSIYLNRCVGNCTVTPGTDNAMTDTSTIPFMPSTLTEYTGFTAGEWEAVAQCVQEVYSPFNVHVVTTRPAATATYTEILVGGDPSELGLPPSVGGIASLAPNCQPVPRGVSFAFTSAIDVFASEAGGSRVNGLCWIIAQETAHIFGLDHEYEFADEVPARSACNDPMTYRADCGGQKFYRNKIARCGEDMNRECRCPGAQNSHAALINVFGAGTSIVPPPTVTINVPAAGGALGTIVAASAGSKRGIEHVDLYLNGYKWGTAKGAAFTRTGQPDPSVYSFTVPANLPNSLYDVEVRAYDDLGAMTSATSTATKGGPCASADACLAGQSCEQGKCFWVPATGQIGDACTYPQFCESGICQGTADQQICTQSCIPGVMDSCPADLTCLESGPGQGICFLPEEEGGCCSVGDERAPWAPAATSLTVLGVLVLRRRRAR
jgi:MYXO-CTERM domain-containing protein